MSDINVQTFSGKVKVSNDLTVTTNVHADYFKGDGSLLTNLPSGSGGVWNTNSDNEIYFISSNVGISNADPGHNLSVGSNLYVDDDGSNVLVVTGNVKADYFVGDGSLLTGLSGSGGVWSTNGDGEIYFINSNVGISNADPGHNLSVGSNLYVDDDGSNVLVVTGNVKADYFMGNGSLLTNLPSGSGGVWSTNAEGEIYFINSNVGISNADPGHNLSVGSNLYVDDDGSNVLVIDGNLTAESMTLGGIGIVPSYPLSSVTDTGNVTPHTIQFTNAETGIVVSSNIVVTGNVTASYLYGDASNVTGITSNLQQIVENGNVTSNTVQFSNATTGLVTTANVEVGGELTVTGNVAVDTDTLFVDSVNDRVGVGTTNPEVPFNVVGNNTLSGNPNNAIASFRATTAIPGTNDAGVVIGSINGNSPYIADVSTASVGLSFYTQNAQRMRINSSGNVGIGTTSPKQMFEVNSTGYGLFSGRLGVGNVLTSAQNGGGQNIWDQGTSAKLLVRCANNANPASTYANARAYAGIALVPGFDASDTTNMGLWGAGSGENPVFYIQNQVNLGNNGGGYIALQPVGGNVGIGTTTPQGKLHIDPGTNGAFMIGSLTATQATAPMVMRDSGSEQIHFYYGTTKVGSITSTGSITAFNTSSDYRLKENIVELTSALDTVNEISVYQFNFISEPTKKVNGFIAHELQSIIPEAVTGVKDEMIEFGVVTRTSDDFVIQKDVKEPEILDEGMEWSVTSSKPNYQGVDQSKLVPLLTRSVQELSIKNDTLETQLTSVLARLDALENA